MSGGRFGDLLLLLLSDKRLYSLLLLAMEEEAGVEKGVGWKGSAEDGRGAGEGRNDRPEEGGQIGGAASGEGA